MTTSLQADIQEIKRAASVICNGLTELRVFSNGTFYQAGYYSDYDALARDAATENVRADGLYIVPNAINPDLLNRSVNHLKKLKNTTSDPDIIARRFLLHDFDPRRPAGISSADAEHEAALERARAALAFFENFGLPKDCMILADSGNGGHVLIRVDDLPNNDESRDLAIRILQVLKIELEDDAVSVDQTTFNASRIWKLYGTIARKGDSTPERPHRLSRMLEVPEQLIPAPTNLVKSIAALAPKPEERPASARLGTYPAFNLESWLSEHNINVSRKEAYQGGTRFILAECPFNPEHNGTSAAIFQSANRAIGFKCQHNGCAGKTWADVRELKEPGYRERQNVLTSNNSFKGDYKGGRFVDVEANPSTNVNEPKTSTPVNTASTPVNERQQFSVEDIKAVLRSSGGWLLIRDLDSELGVNNPELRHKRREYIYRLAKEGFIEKDRLRDDLIRYVNTSANKLVLSRDSLKGCLDIKWPFHIENKVDLFRKSVVVNAGAPNSGKTALSLNVARKNKDRFPITYFSSEMSEQELTERVLNFGDELEDWQAVNFIERSRDFADVIRPDDINIIDYMELNEDIYKVAAYLEQIYERLDKGIAIVNIQKKIDQRYGRGQEFSAEKPRLYLTMDSGKLTITKGKNWHDKKDNPNHQYVTFKLVNGCEFIQQTDWQREED